MTIYNIPYNRQADPNALFTQGFENMMAGLLQGQERKRLGEFAGGMDPEATAMQIVADALSKRINPQMALGLGALQQRGRLGPSQMMALERWNRYQQAVTQGDTETANRLLSSALVNFNIPTGLQLLTDKQRQELAETGYVDKVGLSAAEKNLARKSAEEILGGAKKRFWHWGTEDYTQGMMNDLYRTWRTENTYPEKTERQRKSLDSIWDSLMDLWGKRGIKFDKENILGKGEIEWDPDDAEVMKLREGIIETPRTGEISEQLGDPTSSQLGGATDRQQATNVPEFDINDKTGEARMVFDVSGKEVGIKLKNGQTFKVGSTMTRGGVTYKYVGDNQWQKQ